METNYTLNVHDLTLLQQVAALAEQNARIQWLDVRNHILTGTVRRMCRRDGARLTSTDDVRDAYLEVSGRVTNYMLPIRGVMKMFELGEISSSVTTND